MEGDLYQCLMLSLGRAEHNIDYSSRRQEEEAVQGREIGFKNERNNSKQKRKRARIVVWDKYGGWGRGSIGFLRRTRLFCLGGAYRHN